MTEVMLQISQQILAFCQNQKWHKPHILLGLSGGTDSVFLFTILASLHQQNQIQLTALHLNHQWRSDADKDELFCQQLCEKNKITLHTIRAAELPPEITRYKGSWEETGRKMRRYSFEKCKNELSIDAVCLAHHCDDNLETFFLRLIRGTSLAGLACMQEYDGIYYRPLLNLDKQTIITEMANTQLEFINDPSNQSQQYLRNKIRHSLLPTYANIDARALKNLQRSIDQLNDDKQLLSEYIQKSYEHIFSQENVGNLTLFRKSSFAIQKKIIIAWLIKQKLPFQLSDSFIKEIIRFLEQQQGGEHQLNSTWKICKKQNLFWVIAS